MLNAHFTLRGEVALPRGRAGGGTGRTCGQLRVSLERGLRPKASLRLAFPLANRFAVLFVRS